jgi:cytochrome P450
VNGVAGIRPLLADDPIDLLSDDAVRHAPAFLDRVRETGPVTWSQRHKAWLISGHPELDEAFRDRRLSTERMDEFRARLSDRRAEALSAAIDLLDGWMLFHEPPTHTRLRAPLNRSFTPRAVASLTERVDRLVGRLLDDIAASPAGEVDIADAFAHPLPASVIAELFGVPADDREWLASWSAKFGAVVFGAVGRDDYEIVAREAGEELGLRLGPLLDRYRSQPEDNLLSLLLATEGRDDGLSTIELLGACSLLLFAGHDTTSSFLGSAVLSLLDDPDAADAIRNETVPLEPAIEELLRLDAPAKAMMRTVAEDHERAGQHLEKGQAVFMVIIGANRDPRVFDDPARLHLDRSPNPHLTFGLGHHFCLGAALARLEARMALPALLRRFPQLALAGDVEWKASISDRSAAGIPLRID